MRKACPITIALDTPQRRFAGSLSSDSPGIFGG
jgi:hypothetical protein